MKCSTRLTNIARDLGLLHAQRQNELDFSANVEWTVQFSICLHFIGSALLPRLLQQRILIDVQRQNREPALWMVHTLSKQILAEIFFLRLRQWQQCSEPKRKYFHALFLIASAVIIGENLICAMLIQQPN